VQTVQLEEAQAHLPELINSIAQGQEFVIAKGDCPVAKLAAAESVSRKPQFGSARGKIIFHAGWDNPGPDFEEYQ
jgi:antitoxin (DNA-binding transcriptional repressor) of toxin-antitoxin stability system